MKSEKKKSVFETLSAINVNEHKENKGKMTFLSWAWACVLRPLGHQDGQGGRMEAKDP